MSTNVLLEGYGTVSWARVRARWCGSPSSYDLVPSGYSASKGRTCPFRRKPNKGCGRVLLNTNFLRRHVPTRHLVLIRRMLSPLALSNFPPCITTAMLLCRKTLLIESTRMEVTPFGTGPDNLSHIKPLVPSTYPDKHHARRQLPQSLIPSVNRQLVRSPHGQ